MLRIFLLSSLVMAIYGFPPCNVCGAGKIVGKPEETVTHPITGQSMSCGNLEQAGLAGFVSEADCDVLPQFIAEICICKFIILTPAPYSPVTPAPVFPPTEDPAPTPKPTKIPTRKPTRKPIKTTKKPTKKPTRKPSRKPIRPTVIP
jgi:cell division septation protein DedD